MTNYLTRITLGFVCWWILLMPFDYGLLDWFFKSVQQPFYWLLLQIDSTLIFETDTNGFFIICACSLLLGITSAPLIKIISKRTSLSPGDLLQQLIRVILIFFLVSYGWYKLNGVQFYPPSSNILYTPLGKLTKDIVFWSLAGSAPLFSWTLGIIEIITAILLIVKQTRFIGALMSGVIFGFIFLINLSFDISVKGLSGSLLLFALIYNCFFVMQWKLILLIPHKKIVLSKKPKHLFQYFLVLLLIVEVTYPKKVEHENLQQFQYPDKAFEIINHDRYKYVFVHPLNYIILADKTNEFTDYIIDSGNKAFCHFQLGTIYFSKQTISINNEQLKIKELNQKNLPFNSQKIHLFSDEYH
jgi:hypothetical protein